MGKGIGHREMNKFAIILVLTGVLFVNQPVFAKSSPAAKDNDAKQAQTRLGPVVNVPQTNVNLGTIPRGQFDIAGEIVFANIGDEPLVVHKVGGSCECFIGYSGDYIVQPGEIGKMQVRFDKNQIPTGYAVRPLHLETNDPVNPSVDIDFQFVIERDPIEEHLLVINNELKALRNEVSALRNDINKAIALLENNASLNKKPQVTYDANIYDIEIGSSPTLGPDNAPVTIVMFTDFQCPFCAREYPKIKQVREMYKDKTKFVFKHFPLEIHSEARPAHAAAQLAFEQGGVETFWRMHDIIIASPDKLDISALRGYAEELNLALDVFDEVMADQIKIDDLLLKDKTEAVKCNVQYTPTVFINGLKMQGRQIKDYQKRIDEILAQTDSAVYD